MDKEEARQRRIGFMTAIGMVLERADDSTIEAILSVLNSFGKDLAREIQNDSHAGAAFENGLNPCPEGYHWDEALRECVPD
jgi:hypothetical protein